MPRHRPTIAALKLLLTGAVLLCSACASIPPQAPGGSFSFVDFGDMPYGVKDSRGRTDADILDGIADKVATSGTWPFAVHHGDLGRPARVCNDAALEQALHFWQTRFRVPVFYTPGDNEWEDCDRDEVQPAVSELARLDAIRRILFAQPVSAPVDWQVRAQPGMPENQTWVYRGVVFATFNLVGKGNGRLDVRHDDPVLAAQLAGQRDQRNAEWIAQAFARAQAGNAPAVILVTQEDPFKLHTHTGEEDGSTPAGRCMADPVNAIYCTQVVKLARDFGKPVLFIHGDSNAYCLDQPFPENPGNLWRLNGPGDYKLLDAAIVTVQPASARPFVVKEFSTERDFPSVCDYRR